MLLQLTLSFIFITIVLIVLSTWHYCCVKKRLNKPYNWSPEDYVKESKAFRIWCVCGSFFIIISIILFCITILYMIWGINW